jgi:hypothetical protein
MENQSHSAGFISLPVMGIILLVVVLAVAAGWGFGFAAGIQDALQGNKATIISPSTTSSSSAQLQESSPAAQTNISLETVKKATPTPSPTPKPTPKVVEKTKVTTSDSQENNGTVSLSAVSNETGKVSLSWTVTGEAKGGFKAIWAENENPVYPGDHAEYQNPDARSYTFKDLPSGKTLHFRVGIYTGGDPKISSYSNDVTVTVK